MLSINDKLLIEAVRRNAIERIDKYLIDGAKINRFDENGMTPLLWAAKKGHVAASGILLRYGADVDAAVTSFDIWSGYTALMFAIDAGDKRFVHFLLKNGANVNAVDSKGWTPLMFAMARRHIGIIERIVSFKPDTSLKNSVGDTALMIAQKYNDPNVYNSIQRLFEPKSEVFITLDCSKN